MTAPKTGPLTRAELQEIWKGATDKTYSEAFVKAGDGRGLEVWGQVFAQFERVSQAIDVTTQAMFIRQSSAQTNPPAAGEARATVTLKIARDGLLDRPLVLRAGQFVEEETTDWGPGGGVTVRTGRRYALATDLVFHAGERGPFTVEAVAERPGYGYNNPLRGTIRVLSQFGSLFENNRATVGSTTSPVVLNGTPSRAYMLADNQPDMPVPDHVGQYLYFVNGANRGMTARMLNFVAPQPSAVPPLGSQVDLELLWDVEVNAFAGAFEDGETLAIANGGPAVAYATLLHVRDVIGMPRRIAFVVQNGGSIAVGSTITGLVSGTTATIETVLYATQPVAEAPAGAVPGATWRVLDWVLDWKISATNEAQPEGGRSGMLDELGNEREIYRSPGEDDESYRARVAAIADVVSPNAIKRSLNRSMGAYPWCLREVGSSKFRGFFFDGDNQPPSPTPGRDQCDAFDYDTVTITGAYQNSTTRFRENEPVYLEQIVSGSPPNVVMEARFGRFDSWTPNTGGSGFIRNGILTLIRSKGRPGSVNLVGWRVRGLRSGAIWICEEEIENRAELPRRFRTILDIEQFRAFFKVGVSPIRAGEFGIAFDVGRFNAFDASPYLDFYDGNDTYRSPPVYQNAYSNVDSIRAGGVGFDFYREEDGCVDDKPNGEPLYLVNPATMAGIAGHWETIEGLELDGSNRVQAWRDLSGHGLDWLQGTAGDRPSTLAADSDYPASTFTTSPIGKTRRRAVIFDGAKFLRLVSRQTFPDGYTLVFFGYATEYGTSAGVMNPPNPPNTLFGDDDAANVGGFGFGQFFWPGPYYTNSLTTMTPTLAVAQQVNIGVRAQAVAHDPVTGYIATDGIVSATGPGPYQTAGLNRLGVGAGGTDGFKGVIFAAMVFRRRLTAKELRLLFFRWQYLYL